MSNNVSTVVRSVSNVISFVKDNVRNNFPQIIESTGVSLTETEMVKVMSLLDSSIDQAWSSSCRSVEITVKESLEKSRGK